MVGGFEEVRIQMLTLAHLHSNGGKALLSRKIFANVNSLFANESEIVILGRHVACQRGTGKGAWLSRSGSFQAGPSAGGNGDFIVAGYAGMDAFVTAGATGNFDAQG